MAGVKEDRNEKCDGKIGKMIKDFLNNYVNDPLTRKLRQFHNERTLRGELKASGYRQNERGREEGIERERILLILAWCSDNGKRGRESYIIYGVQCKR